MRRYSGKRLNIETPITKINTTERWQCVGNCSKIPSCTSVNVRKAGNIGNCWIFSENAYDSSHKLESNYHWDHFTLYVSRTVWDVTNCELRIVMRCAIW